MGTVESLRTCRRSWWWVVSLKDRMVGLKGCLKKSTQALIELGREIFSEIRSCENCECMGDWESGR